MEFSLANPGINLTIPLFLPISSQLLKINKMSLPFSLPATPSVFFFFLSLCWPAFTTQPLFLVVAQPISLLKSSRVSLLIPTKSFVFFKSFYDGLCLGCLVSEWVWCFGFLFLVLWYLFCVLIELKILIIDWVANFNC